MLNGGQIARGFRLRLHTVGGCPSREYPSDPQSVQVHRTKPASSDGMSSTRHLQRANRARPIPFHRLRDGEWLCTDGSGVDGRATSNADDVPQGDSGSVGEGGRTTTFVPGRRARRIAANKIRKKKPKKASAPYSAIRRSSQTPPIPIPEGSADWYGQGNSGRCGGTGERSISSSQHGAWAILWPGAGERFIPKRLFWVLFQSVVIPEPPRPAGSLHWPRPHAGSRSDLHPTAPASGNAPSY